MISMRTLTTFLVVGCLGGIVWADKNPPPVPLQLSPSRDWEGNDGQWSSFTLQVGTPPQTVKLLPSITGQSVWVVLTEACRASSEGSCPSQRGGVFNTSESSTWEYEGLFQLPLNAQHYLPLKGDAKIGFDEVTIDILGSDSITLQNQAVNGYLTKDFYIGALGLSPLSVNITSFDDQHLSLMGALRDQGHILSLSYGYTAGASYGSDSSNRYGSLTLGGYDSTRLDAEQNLTIVGGSDVYRPFLLGVESITSGTADLLDAPIIAGLDSLVSHIWLPTSACEKFESVFGLIWDPASELYLVNDSHHSKLVSQDPSITFTLSTGLEQNEDVRRKIEFPYAAFDLTAEPPFAGLNSSVRYFPLKRAQNATQYTLGRVFLQEVYLIADHTRATSSLSLFPAVFPDSGTESDLIPIYPSGHPSGDGADDITKGDSDSSLSQSGIIGVGVGGALALILIAAGVFFFRRRRGRDSNPTVFQMLRHGEGLEVATGRKKRQSDIKAPILDSREYTSEPLTDVKHDLPTSSDGEYHLSPQTVSYASLPRPQSPPEPEISKENWQQKIHELPERPWT